ncbi:MAG TPA: CoA transferase [Pseudomonadales bacterium]|nr:CoA transferase [Pseudomonadales bacterium]
MNTAFEELMQVRGLGAPGESIAFEGRDPVLSTRFKLGETASAVMAAIGVAVNDLWEARCGRRQSLSIKATHAAAALRSYNYLHMGSADGGDGQNWALQRARQRISTPHRTRDGRYFLPHMGLPHLAERVLGVLGCKYELDDVVAAVAKWDALELENAIAEVRACGAMVRTADEWAAHPHGGVLARKPVIEIIKIADSDPEPVEHFGDRPLSGVRALDLTRILAGPTCARTLAEHGADVLMVTAPELPQSERFVQDTSHGKRTCFLDLNEADQKDRMIELIRNADIFSQGYRPGVLAARGFSPQELAELRPGIIYTSMNCYGFDGPFSTRAGWEQLAQSVTGLAAEHGGERPTLLPAAACDYTTGYLAAYGTLLALGLRAREGGSWHVRASLCQSGMFIHRQERVDYTEQDMEIPPQDLEEITVSTDTPYGAMRHLGPVLRMSETSPRWDLPSSPLGSHQPEWLEKSTATRS